MRAISALLAGCVLMASCTDGPEATDLESLVARHVEARGGAEAMEKVATFESDMRIEEPTFAVDGRYVATRDGRMRIDVSMDGSRVFTEALDHERSWSWSPDAGVREGSPQGSAALRHGIEFPFKLFGLHEMAARGHRLELRGRETVDGIDYHVLRLTLDDGFQVTYYVHPDSWLIERERTRRALHVDVDPTPEWIETVYSDYRPAGGILYPYRQVERQVATGNVLSTTTVREIRINPPLAAERVAPP
jgi:hypothetical protein